MGNRVSEYAAAKILHGPGWQAIGLDDEDNRLSWFKRQLVALGVMDMAASTQSQTPINFQKLSFFLGVILSILGGFWWSYQLGHNSGVETGRQQEVIDQMKELQKQEAAKFQSQIDALKSELQKKKELELLNKQGQ